MRSMFWGRLPLHVIAGVSTALLLSVVQSLYGEGVGTPNDSTWFQFFIVGLGGAALLVLYQTRQDNLAMKQALLGFGEQPGLVAALREALGDITELKELISEQDGHRRTLGHSVSRHDRELGDLRSWATEVAPRVDVPYVRRPHD